MSSPTPKETASDHAQYSGSNSNNPYDYEKKYEEDQFGEELGINARVWRVLLDEGRVYDGTTVKGWRETLDIYLVFAGLFSAVVTAFVQLSQALLPQPDQSTTHTALLLELIAVHRASANGVPVDTIRSSTLPIDASEASRIVYWTNRIWYLSLSLSLIAAFVAVLVKQWLQEYEKVVSGHIRRQALVRQYRLDGLNKWKVQLIVMLLPMLLHASLLMFFVGLVLYLLQFDQIMAWVIATLTVVFSTLYVLTNIFPMVFPDCPYKTPISHYGSRLIRAFFARPGQPVDSSTDASPVLTQEDDAVYRNMQDLVSRALLSALETSSNPTVINITAQATLASSINPAAAPRISDVQRGGEFRWFCDHIHSQKAPRNRLQRQQAVRQPHNYPRDNKLLNICLLRMFRSLSLALRTKTPGADKAVMEGMALAMANILPQEATKLLGDVFPSLNRGGVGIVSSNTLSSGPVFWANSSLAGRDPPSAIFLNRTVWHHMLTHLATHAIPSREGTHLALFLWRSIASPSGESPSEETVTLWRLCNDTPGRPYEALARRAIHRLLCGCGPSASQEKHGEEVHRLDDWLHPLHRAVDNYTTRPDDRAEVGSLTFDVYIGFLATRLAEYLATPPQHASRALQAESLEIAASLISRPGVTDRTHQTLATCYHNALERHGHGLTLPMCLQLFSILVKLLTVPHSMSGPQISTLHAMACLFRQNPALSFDETVQDSLDLLRNLAVRGLDDPSLESLRDALAAVFAAYLTATLLASDTSGAAPKSGPPVGYTVIRPQDMNVFMWLAVTTAAWANVDRIIAPSDRPQAVRLREALRSLTPRCYGSWDREMAAMIADPLPLALGMALNDDHGRKVFGELVHHLYPQSSDLSVPNTETLLEMLTVDVQGGDERERRSYLAGPTVLPNGGQLPISQLITPRTYVQHSSASQYVSMPNGVDGLNWKSRMLNRFPALKLQRRCIGRQADSPLAAS